METTETYDVPASVSQRLLWMIKHYRGDYGALNCPVVCRISGPLDISVLQHALDALSARHDSLRTTFHGRGARLTQRIHPPRGEPIHQTNLTTLPPAAPGKIAAIPADRRATADTTGTIPADPRATGTVAADPRAAAERALAEELRLPIDPQEWPARARLWRIGPAEHLFCLNLHHLVTDAWSTGILLRDLCTLYDQAMGGQTALPPVGWSSAQFVDWQRSLLTGGRLGRHQDYWRGQLSGARLPSLASSTSAGAVPLEASPTSADATRPEASPTSAGATPLEAPTSESTRAASPSSGGAGRCETVDLCEEVVAGLRELARREQTTLFTVLLALFQAQLQRVTGQTDTSVASMFANRHRPELRESVGLLAGMVLLRARITPQHTFTELVRQCHRAVVGAFTYSELPFQLLPTDLVDTGGGRADDVMFNVMTETQHLRTSGGVHFELVVPTDIGSRFQFELALVPIGQAGLKAALFRAPDRLDDAGGARFLGGYAELAAAALQRPDASLARLLTTPAHA